MNAETKEILYNKNAFKRHSMASTTKIMTGILAVESGKMNQTVNVQAQALTEGTSIGLKAGDILTLESLVYGMMLESGNDAANVCALHLGKTFGSFARSMNDKAKEIGMNDTNFVTASGLDDEEHYSTAYDMALLGAYSIKNPVFREICSTQVRKIDFIKPDVTVTLSNHNKLLGSCEGVFGIKTGFTKKSGRCLVSACTRDGATLVCVTLNAGDDWNDHRKLYDLSFAELNKTTLKYSGETELSVYGGKAEKVRIYSDDYTYHFTDDNTITQKIIMPKIIYAPVNKNEIIGRICYYSGKKLIKTVHIYTKDAVVSAEETYQHKFSLKNFIKEIFSKRKDR
ncbi:MAG: D-alanyl-D-alanine carboxypeptidase [Clostridia bacterium]|nr:D-alanyl-D-alanine carboxypeptidase [Clostridia bacterium]